MPVIGSTLVKMSWNDTTNMYEYEGYLNDLEGPVGSRRASFTCIFSVYVSRTQANHHLFHKLRLQIILYLHDV